MLIVIPVFHKDEQLVASNLRLCGKLDGRSRHSALVAYDAGYDPREIIQSALPCFAEVRECKYERWTGNPAWPQPQNWAWQSVVRFLEAHNNKDPWLWWEADAIPVRAAWADILEQAYLSAGKPFMGHVVESGGHMNGVAIYPPDLSRRVWQCLLARSQPWDRVLSREATNQIGSANELIGHYQKRQGGTEGMHFMDQQAVNRFLADKPKMVLFHGCTDGSAHKYIHSRGKLWQLLANRNTSEGQKQVPAFLKWITIRKPPRIVHVLERHKQKDMDSERRILRAQESWVNLYRRGMLSAHVWEYPRDSSSIGDARGLPFLKDVLIAGMNKARASDIIMLTNDDTVLHEKLPGALYEILAERNAVSSFRLNFSPGQLPAFDESIEAIRSCGVPDLGRDLFAFRKEWLKKYWWNIPDLFLGELEWDLIMAVMIRRDASAPATRDNLWQQTPGCEMPRGYVMHEKHERLWYTGAQMQAPAKLHNFKLANKWYEDNGFRHLQFKLSPPPQP